MPTVFKASRRDGSILGMGKNLPCLMDETINFVIGPRGQTRPIDGALLFMDVVFALLHIPRPSGGTRPARKSTNYTDRKVLID
jgi:hypothetical protein